MSGWAIAAVVAIVVWGIVQMSKARAGIISDEDGNETYIGREDAATKAETQEVRREMENLRDRLAVLERIATDNNSPDARERARIAAEIEALRGTEDSGVPLPKATTQKEQSQ